MNLKKLKIKFNRDKLSIESLFNASLFCDCHQRFAMKFQTIQKNLLFALLQIHWDTNFYEFGFRYKSNRMKILVQ